MIRRVVFPLVVFSILIVVLSPEMTAQTPSGHEHELISNQIDGSTNPERIQDKDAYRLFLYAITTEVNPEPQALKHQRAVLTQANVTTDDAPKILKILSDFRADYDALVASFNLEAEMKLKIGQNPDIKSFIASRDTLVLATKDKIATALGPQKFSHFHAFVQGEKSKMRVAIE
jgi:hypothetical protein